MNYYQILGLSQTAGISEIKRAYRKLAVTYHPDKNPDPQAEELFKLINEAYDVLSDPDKKRGYDYLLENPGVLQQAPAPRHRDPAYHPERNTQYQQNRKPSLRQMMASYLPYTEKISIACFIISLCFLVDFLLPTRATPEHVVQAYIEIAGGGSSKASWWVIKTNSGLTFTVDMGSAESYTVGQEITVWSSYLFHIPVRYESKGNLRRLGMSIYGNFIFAPGFLLLVSGLGVMARKDVDYGFNLGVSSFMLLILLIVMLIIF